MELDDAMVVGLLGEGSITVTDMNTDDDVRYEVTRSYVYSPVSNTQWHTYNHRNTQQTRKESLGNEKKYKKHVIYVARTIFPHVSTLRLPKELLMKHTNNWI